MYEFLGFDKTQVLTFEEAIEEKIIKVLDNGIYNIQPFYEIGEDSLVYHIIPKFGKERVPVIIDEKNRYINDELVR